MTQLELNENPAGKGRPDTEENDEDYAGNNPNGRECLWERQHAIAHDLGDHEHSHELPRERFVADRIVLFIAKHILLCEVSARAQHQPVGCSDQHIRLAQHHLLLRLQCMVLHRYRTSYRSGW